MAKHLWLSPVSSLLVSTLANTYDLRRIYCSIVDPTITNDEECQTEYQYLVGDSTYDVDTAQSIHLYAESYSPDNSNSNSNNAGASPLETYLSWVKRHVRLGHVVAITVFGKGGTMDEYDHIVNVMGIESDFADDEYHDTDLLIYDDHYNSTYRISFVDFFQ